MAGMSPWSARGVTCACSSKGGRRCSSSGGRRSRRTFGGTVALVDATDDGKGKFRVVIVPDEGTEWPSGRFLRQGTRANGWIMLNRVRIGFELWRLLNGFPPTIADAEPGRTASLNAGKSSKVGGDGTK